MKKFFSAGVLALALICPAGAAEFKGSVYSETAYASLDRGSTLNPGNSYDLDHFRFYNRGSLTAKDSFNEYIKGLISLEGLYIPQDIDPARRSLTQLKIKELYVDLSASSLSARIGKQYIKWGSGTFFNPSSDILNHRRNPLRPLAEAEGNRFAHVTAPLGSSGLTAELAVIQSDEHRTGLRAVEDFAVVPKLSFSTGSLSGFVLAEMQQHAGPLYGTALDYVCSAGQFTDLDFFMESQVKTYTKRYVVEPGRYGYTAQKQSGDSFFLFVGGARLQHSLPEASWLDGISLLFEYYFDTENWTRRDYKRYLDAAKDIHDMQGLQGSSLQYTTGQLAESFHNSRHYVYGGVLLSSLFMRDFYVLNSAVFNMEDGGFIWIPDMYYTFNNQNATVGLRSYCFFGRNNSEFGSAPLHYQAMAYLELSF